MRELDETDMEILSILNSNARKPYSEIGEQVGLSGPAVSDRVNRLKEADIINSFTININRSKLRGGTAVLINLEVPVDALESARTQVEADEAVEHIFVTAEGDIWFYARIGTHGVHRWMKNLLNGNSIEDYTVTLVEDAVWTPAVDGMEFAIDCVECGKSIDSEGETAQIGGEIYHFCCSSCLTRFEDRYQRLAENQ